MSGLLEEKEVRPMRPDGFRFNPGSNSALQALAASVTAQQAELRASLTTTIAPALQQVALAYKPVMPASMTSDLIRHASAALEPARMLSAWSPKITVPKFTIPPIPTFTVPTGMFDVLRGFDWDAFERRIRVPRNWPTAYEQYLPGLTAMVNDEGIPVAWVPRWELLETLLCASDATARSLLLVEHRDEILHDCETALDDVSDPSLMPFMPTVQELLSASRYGLWKVAAISAVAITHSIVERLEWVSARQQVKKHHALQEDVTLAEVMERATRGPLVLFYDDWNPKSRRPRPTHLTRHVVSHRFGPEQVAERNCVVAVMLLTSLMVTVDQLELISPDEEPVSLG
ncbi:hypothetical protein [Curtobacterium sp. 1544]|uniref:hypothetical protein n=1 Tax=Curtobacterium sp. 1544 TaxID=3156417 RepID=UPI0033966643